MADTQIAKESHRLVGILIVAWSSFMAGELLRSNSSVWIILALFGLTVYGGVTGVGWEAPTPPEGRMPPLAHEQDLDRK